MKIYYLFILFLFQLYSCQKNEIKNKNTSTTNEESKINFIDYPIDDLEGITSEGHEGVYRNFDFNYTNGEAYFLLVPKIGPNKWYSTQKKTFKNSSKDIDASIEKKLNSMSFKQLSGDFDIWVFHIPKIYMRHTPNMDTPYSPKIPRTTFVYKYINGKWEVINKYIVNSSKDEEHENNWRQKMFDNIINKANQYNTNNSLSFKEKMQQNGYSVYKEATCDLNGDSQLDYILVFSKGAELTEFILDVLLSNKNGGYTVLENSRAIQSNPHTTYATGLENIVVKNNYFTLEENTSGGDPSQNIYTTFMYDKKTNSVKLHKYGIETIYPDTSKDWSKTYSEKDFGIIKFSDFDSNSILDNIKKK